LAREETYIVKAFWQVVMMFLIMTWLPNRSSSELAQPARSPR
jgi:hypothetical protein